MSEGGVFRDERLHPGRFRKNPTSAVGLAVGELMDPEEGASAPVEISRGSSGWGHG